MLLCVPSSVIFVFPVMTGVPSISMVPSEQLMPPPFPEVAQQPTMEPPLIVKVLSPAISTPPPPRAEHWLISPLVKEKVP